MKAPTEPQNHVDSFHSPGEVESVCDISIHLFDLLCNLRQTAATSTAKHGLSPDHRRGNLDRPDSWLPEHLGDNQSYGGFLKWWYQTAIGFPTKNDHFGVFWGYQLFRKHRYSQKSHFDRQISCDFSAH